MTTPAKVATTIKVGTRIVVEGRFGVVEEVTATDLLVRFNTHEFVVSRRLEQTIDQVRVPWSEVVDVGGTATIMDDTSRTQWDGCQPHNQRKLMARLAVVTLVHTGTRSGNHMLLDEGEPIVELAPTSPIKVTPRIEILVRLLNDAPFEWIQDLVADLNASDRPDATPRWDPPSSRTIHRWVGELSPRGAGLFGLIDDRGGNRTTGFAVGDRRENTERLVDQVIANRNVRTKSNSTDRWVIEQVRDLAENEGKAVLGRSQLAALVSSKLNAAGRKPSQVKTARHHEDRDNRQSSRSVYVAEVQSLDATLADNLVKMTPDGEPLRPYIQMCVENSTGVMTSVHATGLYKSIHIAALMHDAFSPSLIVPDPDELTRTRMKGIPKEVHAAESTFKPGAIPGRIRSDNAAQNHSRFILGIAESLGCDVIPSRPGVSPDNGLAEAAIGALRTFCEGQPGYVGRDTTERATGIADGEILMIDEYEARLQHFANFVYNHARTTAPLYSRTGLSRLQHWDDMIEIAGAPPMLLDRNALFAFLARNTVTRTPKGIRVGNHFYSSPALFRLPKHLIDQDRQVTVVHDPRLHDCVWIEDPVENIVFEIPNILHDVMEGPLTQGITQAALRRARVRSIGGYHAAAAFAHHAALVRSFERTARIDRELADWRGALRGYHAAIGNGAVVVGADGVLRDPSNPGDPNTATMTTADPGGHGGSRVTHGGRPPVVDLDLDRPLPRPGGMA